MFPLRLLIFAVLSGQPSTVLKVAGMGALFGLFAYATYDLTDLAVVKNWPLGLTFIDIAWGASVTGVTATAREFALRSIATANSPSDVSKLHLATC